MPNLDIVSKHLRAISQTIAQLKRHVPFSEQQLRENIDLLWILERGLYLCIQNILDCFAHIIAADLNDQWDTYAEAVAILRAHNIVSADEEEVLNKMIGLRNRLSHHYLGLNLNVLTDVANNRLNELTALAELIARYANLPLPGDT